jgi:hypothetical protein
MTILTTEPPSSLPPLEDDHAPIAVPGTKRSDALGGIPLVAVSVAVGVILVAIGFARGRADQSWSNQFYWVGEALVYLSPAVLLLRRRKLTLIEGGGIAVILALATYAIKVCYSPLTFTFSDEYQHLTTLQSILSTHHLFHSNPNLAVSPFYPGLEVLTSAFATLSHLSVYASAATLLGLAHLATTLGIFYLAMEIIPNPRVAALTVFVYATGSDYQFFTSYFAYESLGLPLAILSLLALIKMVKSSSSRGAFVWGFASIALGSATVVTHHVSSYALVALELCVVGSQFVKPLKLNRRNGLAAVVIVTAGFLVIWELVVAKPTFSYLRSTLSELLIHGHTLAHVTSYALPIAGGPILTLNSASQAAPPFDRWMGYAWAVILLALLTFGLFLLWRNRRQSSALLIAMAVASPIVYIAFVIQIVAPGGSELGTRLSAFALIPGALICGFAIDAILRHEVPARFRLANLLPKVSGPIPLVLASVLVVGAIAATFPPFYSRIPGSYTVGGENRDIDAYDLTASLWVRENLPPGNQVATDNVNGELMDSIGLQYTPGYASALLLLSTSVSPEVAKLIRSGDIQYVAADKRITSAVPVDGNPIFPDDPFQGHYLKRIPEGSLDKFNSISGVSRIFDDGPIVIYDLRGSIYLGRGGS